MLRIVLITWLTVVGCAANAGVTPMGQGTYIIVERQAATGFSGAVSLKLDALREAIKQCEALGKEMRVVSATEPQLPYRSRKYPREVQLKCLAKR